MNSDETLLSSLQPKQTSINLSMQSKDRAFGEPSTLGTGRHPKYSVTVS